jgi:hypothetical protein
MKPAKLSSDRIGSKVRTLASLAVGETCYSWSAAMLIDADRNAYVNLSAIASPNDLGDDLTVLKLTRKTEGWHVHILRKGPLWEPVEHAAKYPPVIEITEA